MAKREFSNGEKKMECSGARGGCWLPLSVGRARPRVLRAFDAHEGYGGAHSSARGGGTDAEAVAGSSHGGSSPNRGPDAATRAHSRDRASASPGNSRRRRG